MAAIALMLVAVAPAVAARPWLEVEAGPDCPAAHVAEQIERRVVGERNQGLKVELELSGDAGATVVLLRIWRGSEALGSKELLAASCDEALDAAATVIALALSSPPSSVQPALPAATAEPAREARVAPPRDAPAGLEIELNQAARPGPRYRDEASAPREHHPSNVHLAGAAGFNLGTLGDPTAVVGVGARVSRSWGELRGFVWYGLPTTREEVSTVVERTRSDVLAMTLNYCRDFDRARWLSLCAGLEASLRRTSHVQQTADEPARVDGRLEPTFGPSLGAGVAYRGVRWVVPHIDLAVQAPLLATPDRSQVGLRAAIGAALPF